MLFPGMLISQQHGKEDRMMNISIHDSNQLIKFACEDLEAIRSVILAAEDHPEYGNGYEMLTVVRRALDPIIRDMNRAVSSIDKELQSVQQQ